MIDEAQELAPLELALLGRTLKPDGTLIVAGDAEQQMDEAAAFLGWADTMRELGYGDHETVELGIGYRCPPEVVALARAILTPTSDHPSRPFARLDVFRERGSQADWLAQGLRYLQRRDRRASVAIVCRSALVARQLVSDLQARDLPIRLVFDGRFLPRGVQVTTVDQVKGLEFDFVVVPDVDARSYANDQRARRALYVAVTRARHEVALSCIGDRSDVCP
jgi:DNA helicase IV